MTTQKSSIEQAVSALKQGKAVVFPTDTVYGVGVAVSAAKSPQVLYDLKERERGKPIAWLVGGVEDIARYGRGVPAWAHAAAHAYWPGPLTLVVRASERVPAEFRSAAGTIGLRMPDNETALALLCATGEPLATTSANLSGHEAPCSFSALDPVLAARVGVVVVDNSDNGKSGLASTVVDCTGKRPVVVRTGFITLADIETFL